jgi:peroxiredoxin
MDNNNEVDVDRWAKERLASLRPDSEWQPDLSRGLARLEQRRGEQRGVRQRRGWVMAGVVAMGVPLMALPVTRAIAQRCVSACVQESSRVRQFLLGPNVVPNSTYVAIADREIAPDFTVTDAAGKQVSLSDFRGKAVLLNFWATWCSPCKVEIPMLKGLQEQYRDNGFTVLGVSLDEGGLSVVKPYMETAQFNYPILLGNEDVAKQYGGLDAVPTTLLIDKSGRIAALHVGLCNRSEYEADIDAVLKEQ